MMVTMGIDNIMYHDMELHHARILNSWIEDWESGILVIQYQDNEQCLMKKYKNLRFIDDEDNHNCMIVPEKLEPEGTSRINKQYCVVRNTLNRRDRDNVDLLISR